MIFEIQLHKGSLVYMSGDEDDYYSVVFVDSKKFKNIWDERQMNDRSSEQWYINKYNNAENCFSQSKSYPVPMSIVGGIHDYGTQKRILRLDDGITRIQWMFDHGVNSFPVLCPKEVVGELAERAGV